MSKEFLEAVETGDLSSAQQILQRGANVNFQEHRIHRIPNPEAPPMRILGLDNIEELDNQEIEQIIHTETALHIAARRGR